MKPIFDYSSGEYIYNTSGNMMFDTDGNMLLKMGSNMAMAMDSGELHILSNTDSDDEEDW